MYVSNSEKSYTQGNNNVHYFTKIITFYFPVMKLKSDEVIFFFLSIIMV